jgi:hypothetical protein
MSQIVPMLEEKKLPDFMELSGFKSYDHSFLPIIVHYAYSRRFDRTDLLPAPQPKNNPARKVDFRGKKMP